MEPDFHDLESFQQFSGLSLLDTNTEYSSVWADAVRGSATNVKGLSVSLILCVIYLAVSRQKYEIK